MPQQNRTKVNSTPSSTRNRSQLASDLIARQGDSPPEAQERGRRPVLHQAIPKERVPCNARQPNHAIWHRWLVLLQYDSIGSSNQFHCGLIHPLHDVGILLPAFWIPTHNLSTGVPTPYVDGDAVCDALQPDRHHRGSFSASGICGNPCCFSYAKWSIPPLMRCLRVAAESSEHLQFLCGGKDKYEIPAPCRYTIV